MAWGCNLTESLWAAGFPKEQGAGGPGYTGGPWGGGQGPLGLCHARAGTVPERKGAHRAKASWPAEQRQLRGGGDRRAQWMWTWTEVNPRGRWFSV